MKTLSPKQQQIYDYIVSFSASTLSPRCGRSGVCGLKSPSLSTST